MNESIDTTRTNLLKEQANQPDLTSQDHKSNSLRADAILGLDAWNKKVADALASPATKGAA